MSSKRLIICCAPAGVGTGSNLGMQTVDYAAHNLVQRLGFANCAEIHRPWKALCNNLGGDESLKKLDVWPTRFVTQMDREFIQPGDLLLSWGDFQLGYDYQIQSALRYREINGKLGKQVDADTAMNWCYQYFLLEKQLRRDDFSVASFGTTLFQNSMKDWTRPRYRSAIDAYMSRCQFAKFRDPFSTWAASRLTANESQQHAGIDCALLNTRDEMLAIEATGFHQSIEEQSIGVYLGRSSKKLSKWRFSTLLNELSKKLDARLFWLPWNRFAGGKLFIKRPRMLRSPFVNIHHPSERDEMKAGDIFRMIDECQLIVTDTYHIAINAMVMGTPVLCVYEPAPESDRNANMGYRESWRDKRSLLFMGTNQADLLLPAEDLRQSKWRRRKVDHVAELLSDKATLENWRAWIRDESVLQRNMLDQQLLSWHAG